MFVLAITGGIGAGKSETARYFASRGAAVLDLDEVAKRLLDVDDGVRTRVVSAFGQGILDRDGGIAHRRLAAVAFASDEGTRTLNAIVHPKVVSETQRWLDTLVEEGTVQVAVVDVPLLAEAPQLLRVIDLTLCLEAPETVRLQRLESRGMSREDVLARMDRQAGEAERHGVSDVVVDNSGTRAELEEQLDRMWEREVAPHVA